MHESREIRATYTDKTIRVYQAYNKQIAEEAISLGISKEKWQELVKASDVRVQWDPEKDINGNNLPYRSLQLGLRGKALPIDYEKIIEASACTENCMFEINTK